jgi:hypothetical protein
MDKYNEASKKKYSYNTINSKLNTLARKGYLDKHKSDFGDQKATIYAPLKLQREKLTYKGTEH